jgi:sugar (pentulose or hexulose) kinase
MSHTIGIDIGTTGIKVGLLDLATFRLDSLASSEIGDTLELQSGKLWLQIKRTLKEALGRFDKESVLAIGVGGQMHGTVFYNRQGQKK